MNAQVFPCPTCGRPLRGLLDACPRPECLRADLDVVRRAERRADR